MIRRGKKYLVQKACARVAHVSTHQGELLVLVNKNENFVNHIILKLLKSDFYK